MRAELVVYAALASVGAATAEAVQAPDFATKAIMICAGTLLGSVAAAFLVPNASPKHRAQRGLLSVSAGPVFAYIALALWPENSRFEPREWIVVVAATTSFCAWMLLRWIQKRRGAIEERLDEFADGMGVPKRRDRESGRASPRLIGWLVLAAALAHGIAACFLPAKPADFCDQQPASVDKIIAAQERGVMTEDEVETFFDLLWLASAKCDGSDQAAIDEVKTQLEDLARKVEAR